MPRYFIDLHDGSQHIRDKDGFEVPDVRSMRGRAVSILSAIAQDFEPGIDHQACVAAIRDEAGTVVFRVRLTLGFEWPT